MLNVYYFSIYVVQSPEAGPDQGEQVLFSRLVNSECWMALHMEFHSLCWVLLATFYAGVSQNIVPVYILTLKKGTKYSGTEAGRKRALNQKFFSTRNFMDG